MFNSAKLLVALMLLAWAATASSQNNDGRFDHAAPSATTNTLTRLKQKLTPVTVYKSATCSCCKLWADHMQAAGFSVQTTDVDNLDAIKQRVGVPAGKGSCHTAQIGGYFIEGHVPAADVQRLLKDRPKAKGLTAPGMPMGSPGMETPSGHVQAYEVLLVGLDGKTTVFSRHP